MLFSSEGYDKFRGVDQKFLNMLKISKKLINLGQITINRNVFMHNLSRNISSSCVVSSKNGMCFISIKLRFNGFFFF